MAKPFNDKIKTLKGIINGTSDLSILRPPQFYVAFIDTDGIYTINNKKYTQAEYNEWVKSVRDIDTIIQFSELRTYEDDNAPIKEERETLVPIAVKVVKEAEEKKTKESIRKVTEPCKEAAIEPRLRPYSEHVAFNNNMYKKLFS